MKDLPNREKSPFQIDPTDMQILMEEIAPYWEGKTYHEHLNKVLPAEIRGVTYHDERGLKSKFVVSETSSYRSALQWVPDYEKAMKRGFIDIQNEAKAKLAGLEPDQFRGHMGKEAVPRSHDHRVRRHHDLGSPSCGTRPQACR